jgi:hypothetical protein
MQALGDFFLTEWLWSISWGWYQAPLAACALFLLLILTTRMRTLAALITAISVNLFSWALFTALICGGLIHLLNHVYTPTYNPKNPEELSVFVGFALALIYVVLQMIPLYIVHRRYTHNFKWLLFLSIISNALAAWIVFSFLPVY